MAEITIEGMAKTMEGVLRQELAPVKDSLTDIKMSQATHATALDQLLREKSVREGRKDRSV